MASSAIKDFEKTEKGLKVTFQSGKSYLYEGVPANVILGLERAESKGRYFMAEIKPNIQQQKLLKNTLYNIT